MVEPRKPRPGQTRDVATSPIRWDRVAAVSRRNRLILLVSVVVGGVVAAFVAIVLAFAGKTAIDPSFSPPILSRTSAEIEVESPEMGWALVPDDPVGPRGYVEKAALSLQGLKGEALLPHWSIRPTGNPSVAGHGVSRAVSAPVVPASNADNLSLRRWVPSPAHVGRYVSELRLTTTDGRTVGTSTSQPFFVLGRDCCRRYETATYVSRLPRGWHLREDYEPNPGERHVTLAIGPVNNSIDVDTSIIDPENVGKSGLYFQRILEQGLAESGEGYSRIDRHISKAPDGELVVEWSYRVEGDDFTNILFFRGPSGFAVLGRSGASHFRETRDLTRLIARSVVAKPVPGWPQTGG